MENEKNVYLLEVWKLCTNEWGDRLDGYADKGIISSIYAYYEN